jgi:hypothetical protein
MMRAGIISCCVMSTWSIPGGAAAPEPPPPVDATAGAPDATDLAAAFITLRRWLADFTLPDPSDPAASLPLQGASGACVIVRHRGQVIGTGTDFAGAEDGLLVRRAAGRAFGQALGDPRLASLPEELRNQATDDLTLELEVAGAVEPLLGRAPGELDREIEPGIHGMAMRRRDRWAAVFPSVLLAGNRTGRPARSIQALAIELGLAPAETHSLLGRREVTAYRFKTLHLAQAAPGGPPVPVFRGQSLVEIASVTRRSIGGLADAIAGHILATPFNAPAGQAAGHLGLMGDYDTVRDRFEPAASPLEQALLAYALARYGRAPGVDSDRAAEARDLARRTLRALAVVGPGEGDPLVGPTLCAAIVLAALEDPKMAEDPAVRGLLAAATDQLVRTIRAGDWAGASSPHRRALIAAGASRLAAAGTEQPPRLDPAAIRGAIDAAWAAAPHEQAVALLPWIGLAESWHAGERGYEPGTVERLQRLAEVLEQSRIGTTARPGPPDMHGGFALASGGTRHAASTRATAQSLRPAAFLAAMARDPALVPPEQAGAALGRHLLTVRFVMQLTVRQDSRWSLPDPDRALGGIRAAPSRSDLPAAAQAMGLLTVVETLWTLEHVLGPPGAGDGARENVREGPAVATSHPVALPLPRTELLQEKATVDYNG